MTEIAIQLDDDLLARLRAIAARDGHRLEDLIADGAHLIAANEDEPPREFTPKQIAAIEEGRADLDAGRLVPHEQLFEQLRDDLEID